MDSQILEKIERYKKAIAASTDPDIISKMQAKVTSLESDVAKAEAAIEKKEEKIIAEENKQNAENAEKIERYKKAIAASTDPDVIAKLKIKLDKMVDSAAEKKQEIKEEKKEIAEQKKEVKEAAKEVEKIVKKAEVAEKKQEQKSVSDAEDKIKRIEKAIAAQTDEDVKKRLNKTLSELKGTVSDVKKEIKQEAKKPIVKTVKQAKPVRKTPIKKAAAAAPAPKKAAPKKEERKKKLKGVLAELDALIEKNRRLKAKYGSAYKGTGKPSDLERDSKRKAKPFGYRFVGKHDYRVPTEMQIKRGLKRGTIDYEARPNRADVSVKRKVKLEDGGMAGNTPEWLVMIKSEEGNTHQWQGFAKSEDEALHKAEQDAGFESIESGIVMVTDENGEAVEFKKGGKTKEKWIQDALAGKKGVLRATATRKGLLRGEDDKLSKTDLKKLQKMGGKTAKRAHLAETLSKFKKGGKVGYSAEDKARFAKPAGWRWKEEALKRGKITRSDLAKSPSKYMRDKYPDLVYYENRLNKSDKKPTRTSAPSV